MSFLTNNNKNDTIDPLSTIIKLYILTFKGPGSKISIYNNKVTINHSGSFQGIVRYYNNAAKNDIIILTMPILYACNKYLIVDNKKYLFIFEKVIEAFNILKTSYEGNEIIHNIDSLIGIINEYRENQNYLNSTYNTESGKLKQAFYNSISKVWTNERLVLLFSIINQLHLEIESNGNKNIMLNILETFMNFIDEKVHNIINGLI